MKPFWGNEEAGERLKAQILYLNDILYLFCFKHIDSLFFLNECFQRLKSAHLNDVYFSWVEREIRGGNCLPFYLGCSKEISIINLWAQTCKTMRIINCASHGEFTLQIANRAQILRYLCKHYFQTCAKLRRSPVFSSTHNIAKFVWKVLWKVLRWQWRLQFCS